MNRILPKAVLVLLLISVLNVPFLSVSKANDEIIRVPGVKAGDWAKYKVAVNYSTNDSNPPITPPPPEFLNIDYYKLEVLSVIDSVINFQAVFHLKNGTEISNNMATNVSDSSMGSPFFIAANLSAGDALYSAPFSPTINATLLRMYAGMERQVNYVSVSSDAYVPPGFKANSIMEIYWDRATGIIDELLETMEYERISGHNVTRAFIHLVMTETNIWSPQVTHIQVELFIFPRILNLRSQGRWIMAFVILPQGTLAYQVDLSTVMLNGTVPATSRASLRRLLLVKLDREQLEAYILSNVNTKRRFASVTLTVAGRFKNGTVFEGSDTIRVIILRK